MKAMAASVDGGLPSRAACMQLLQKYEVPENIVRHSQVVCRVAVYLAERLQKSGIDIDTDIVERACLLHDIDKMQTLEGDLHGEISEQILVKEGFPGLGRIVRHHRMKYLGQIALSWEEKVLLYADKRVTHDHIVSLDERFSYFATRYPDSAIAKKRTEQQRLCRELEEDIFTRIGERPDELAGDV
jgi:uncharacterized protein